MGLIDKIKDIIFLKKIRYFRLKYVCKKKNKVINENALRRASGYIDPNYSKLLSMKDLHDGKRCFIVATGPSLTLQDLDLLKNEITFGMNSICKIYDKTNWRPTYYGIQDIYVYPKMKELIEMYCKDSSAVFVSDELSELYKIDNNFIKFPFNSAYHLYEQHFYNFFSKFSDNAYAQVYDGYSITYSLIQIAVYMGFKEIYLLGCDCNYIKGEKNHFVESGHIDRLDYLNYDKMITGYKAADEYAKKNGIKIINCTRGGMLEIFDRIRLEDLIN